MKRQEIEKVERLLAATFKARPEFSPDRDWQSGVMGAVRRHYAAAANATEKAFSPLMSLALMWRLAMGGMAAALLCVVFYMATPEQTAAAGSLAELVPLDSYESAVTVVARL